MQITIPGQAPRPFGDMPGFRPQRGPRYLPPQSGWALPGMERGGPLGDTGGGLPPWGMPGMPGAPQQPFPLLPGMPQQPGMRPGLGGPWFMPNATPGANAPPPAAQGYVPRPELMPPRPQGGLSFERLQQMRMGGLAGPAMNAQFSHYTPPAPGQQHTAGPARGTNNRYQNMNNALNTWRGRGGSRYGPQPINEIQLKTGGQLSYREPPRPGWWHTGGPAPGSTNQYKIQATLDQLNQKNVRAGVRRRSNPGGGRSAAFAAAPPPQAAGGQAGGGESAIQRLLADAQQQSEAARAANEQRYEQALGGAQNRYYRNMQRLEGQGERARSDIDRGYRSAGSRIQQDMVSRGLSASTIGPSMQAGLERSRGDAVAGLNERLAQQAIDVDARLSGDVLGMIERRQDEYPDMGQLIQLAMLSGQSGPGMGEPGGYQVPQFAPQYAGGGMGGGMNTGGMGAPIFVSPQAMGLNVMPPIMGMPFGGGGGGAPQQRPAGSYRNNPQRLATRREQRARKVLRRNDVPEEWLNEPWIREMYGVG